MTEADTPRTRLRGLLRAGPDAGNLVAALLLAALGFGAAITVAADPEDVLDRAGRDDLVRILDRLTVRADQLDASLAALQATRDDLASGADAEQAAADSARQRLADLSVLAGTVPASGPGLQLRVVPAGDSNGVSAGLLLRAVHELRDAGAEAIQIDGARPVGRQSRSVRIVAATAFLAAEGGIDVGGTVLAPPYTLLAIGDADTLATAVQIPGGVVSEVEEAGAVAVVEALDEVLVSALQPESTPEYARPALPPPS